MDLSPPPQPPLPSPSPTPSLFHSFPVMAIAIIGILATAFLLVGYYVFVIKCCLNWHRRRRRNPTDFSAVDTSDIQKNGLEEAVIRSIPVIKFRKLAEQQRENNNNNNNDKSSRSEPTESYECAVCLSEFEDGEQLRVIPNCCHAFHIDCIDVWLQNSANCPLCRSGISLSSIPSGYPTPAPAPENPPENSAGDDEDYVVIEIQGNNLDEPRLISSESKEMAMRKKGRKLEHSMGDEWIDMREKDKEFGDVQPIRRSISMDWSKEREFCIEMQGVAASQQCGEIIDCEERRQDCNMMSSSSGSGRVRRSIFSFGYGRSSRGGSVQPLHLDS